MLYFLFVSLPCSERFFVSTGIVKRVPNVRNYGFVVTGDDGPEEIFFHRTDVAVGEIEQLTDGLAVEFEVIHDQLHMRKRRATRVTPIGRPAAD